MTVGEPFGRVEVVRSSWVVVSAVVVLTSMVVSGCSVVVDGVRGSGEVVSEERTLDTFSTVLAMGSPDVRITQGDVQSVTVRAEDNIVPLLETDVRGGVLTLRVQNRVVIRPTEPMVFDITVVDLESVETSGSGDLGVDGWNADDAEIRTSGSGDVVVDDLRTQSLTVETSGSGDVDVSGTTTSQRAQTSGSGGYRACRLDSEVADVSTSGSGEALVTVTERLDADISGSGDVRYAGDPEEVSQDSSGSGDVEPIADCPT